MKRYSIFCFLILLLTGCSLQRNNKSQFNIIQMTDTQFGFFTNNNGFYKEVDNYRSAINHANKLQPDFVIVTGDLTNKPFDSSQISAFKRVSLDLDKKIPLYFAPGNHDIGNEPAVKDIEKYEKEFGKSYYSIQHKHLYAIILNSLYLHKPDKVREQAAAQQQWLENELKKANTGKYRHKIIFLHHPLFLKSAEEADGYFTIPQATRMQYLKLFEKYNISHVFAGHYHQNAFGKYNNIEMVTSGPVGKPLGKAVSGYTIITVTNQGISHSYEELRD